MAVIAVVAILAAAGTTAVILSGRHDTPRARDQALAVPTQSVASSSAAPGTSGPPPSSAPAVSPPADGGQTVAVAANAAQDTAAPSVAAFLGQYFSTINSRDYQTYMSLRSPQAQQGLTAQQFAKGFASTSDSAETLTGLSTASNGDTVAAVTFTSHQNPADSVDQAEACTNWDISLFLQPDGTSYLIDLPPSGYQASHSACP
jgi:hypothetical protein